MDFCLIHLSDFHLRTSDQLKTDKVLRSLNVDLKQRLESLDLPNPHIALSGDLAFGGREEEYSIVDGFVSNLADNVHARSMSFCGGNHDVNWSLLNPLGTELMNVMVEDWQGGKGKTEARVGVDTDRELLTAGMGPYYAFLEGHGIHSSPDLFYTKQLTVSNLKLNIISLNSAYLFSRKYNYHGYVGLRQMTRAEEQFSRERSPSFNITLVHHPIEAIVPTAQEETRQHLFSWSDVILSGHTHSPGVTVEYTAGMLGRRRGGPPPVISGARCVFDDSDDSTIIPGYSIIGIDFEYERAVSLKVWEVEFDRAKERWHYDENKHTYPLEVRIPTEKKLGSEDSVGPKVTDAERKLLGSWAKGRDKGN